MAEQTYIVDLTAVRGQDPKPAPPWELIPVDLNKEAKGDYIWLYKLRGDIENAIRLIYVMPCVADAPPEYTKLPLNLNSGTRGAPIYLCYSRVRGSYAPIKNVHVVAAPTVAGATSMVPSDYEVIPGDLNLGAGGDYIYVTVQR